MNECKNCRKQFKKTRKDKIFCDRHCKDQYNYKQKSCWSCGVKLKKGK